MLNILNPNFYGQKNLANAGFVIPNNKPKFEWTHTSRGAKQFAQGVPLETQWITE